MTCTGIRCTGMSYTWYELFMVWVVLVWIILGMNLTVLKYDNWSTAQYISYLSDVIFSDLINFKRENVFSQKYAFLEIIVDNSQAARET